MRSILSELDALVSHKDKETIIESRAHRVIQGAINLIEYMREQYDPETAAILERRLVNSIKSQDASKFVRGIRKI